MNILMIYPNKEMVARAPLGIGYLSSYLKNAGHDFKLFDTTFIKCGDGPGDDALREKNLQVINPDFLKYNLIEKQANVYDELLEEIKMYKPDIICMSTVDPNHQFGIDLLKHCKLHYPTIPIICGGPLATLVPEDIIVEDCIDIVARGECEEQLVNLVDIYEKYGYNENLYNIKNFWIKDKDYKYNNKIYKNEVTLPDISKGLPPDLSIFDSRHFIRPLGGKMYKMATVIWTRGCIFKCSYCANETFYKVANKTAKAYYRKKDTDLLIQELAYFKKEFNLNFLMFVDDIFPLHDRELMEEFCKLYKEYVDLPFSINIQPKLVDEETFKLAVEAGMRNICCGVESGSKAIRKNILRRSYNDDDVKKVFSLAHKYNIRSSSFNIIGLPDETREDIFKTIALNKEINPTSATVTFFHPYRGAPLRDLCIERKYIDETQDKHEDVYRAESHLNMPQITKKELSNIMESFQLYMKLPKEYYKLIEMQEDQSTFEAIEIRKKILLPEFKKIQEQESQWDFTKKTEWWKND